MGFAANRGPRRVFRALVLIWPRVFYHVGTREIFMFLKKSETTGPKV
jgi:hypothetical protein